jgi:hypothetical protein
LAVGDKVDLATEDEIAQLFRDCARGAVPAVVDTTASTRSRMFIWKAATT